MARTISSPGVEINEVDLSLRVNAPIGVNVLAMGFTNQGPTDEIFQITSLEEYEALFGKPTTPAERYSYHTIKPLFNSPANVFFSRLPYGGGNGDIFSSEKYSALVYPVYGDNALSSYAEVTNLGLSASQSSTWYLSKPYHVELSRTQYESIINNEITWYNSFGKDVDLSNVSNFGYAGLVILNTAKTTINEIYEGYYIGISDNRNTDPGSPYLDIVSVNSVNNNVSTDSYVTVPSNRLDFKLSALTDAEDSISETIENIPSFNIGTNEFTDTLSIGVFKLRKTPFTNAEIALSYALTESFVGSLDVDRELKSSTGGANVSFFLETVDDTSNNIKIFVNSYLANSFSLSLTGTANPTKSIRVLDNLSVASISYSAALIAAAPDDYANELFPLGVYQQSRGSDKTIGSVAGKVERVLDLVENPDLFELDVTLEGGLGTIFCSTQELGGNYDDTVTWPSLSGLQQQTAENLQDPTTLDNYNTIFNLFNTFAKSRRKDHIFIADPIRQIFVTGKDSRVLKQTYVDEGGNITPKTFSKYIYWPLRNQFRAANSSYSTVYANWVKVFDVASNQQTWVPFSGYAATTMANMDEVWDAPAGLTRGIIDTVNDIAIYPKLKERDQLYKISLNPVMFSPSDGFVIWGQKTLQSKPSAFDRINVRRAFLYLEKATLNTVKYFVFEPNNLFTRTQVINVLTPLFEAVKNKSGITDYLIVCNEKNNTPEIIEQNEMKIDIYIKPQKTAEFILVDFIATRQDASFEELI